MDTQLIGAGSKKPEDLWQHQIDSLKALREIDKENKNKRFSTLINLPTGAGKTEVIRQFCMEKLGEGNRILFIADRIALLEQSISKFLEYKEDGKYTFQLICGDHGKDKNDETEDEDSEVCFKKQKISQIESGTPIIFASIGTIKKVAEEKIPRFVSWIEKSQEEDKRLYIVYDEAHHIGTDSAGAFMSAIFHCKDTTYVKGVSVEYKQIERVGLIGLTATVYRGDNFIESFNAWFKDGYDFEHKKVVHIDSVFGDYLLDDLDKIRNNRIAPVDVSQLIEGYNGDKPVLADPDFIKVSEYKDGMPDTPQKEMEYLADRIHKNFTKLGKIAIIVKNQDMVSKLCKQLEEKGITGIDFTSKGLKEKNRTKILNKFKKPDNKSVLVAISIFDEGIDVADLNTIYLYAPTNSQVVLRQRVGRVLRTVKGKKLNKRVIWQYYPQKCKKITNGQYTRLLNSNFDFVKESDKELKADIAEWKASNGKLGIPPIIYKEPLPKEELSYVVSPSDKKVFEKIYGKDAIEAGVSVGYFYNASKPEEEKIYVRQVEKDSYMQYHRVLQNDWLSIQKMRQDICTFELYAKMLQMKDKKDLIADIKKICFSLSVKDAFNKNGTVKNTVVARDEDIIRFFDWFISGEIRYKELISSEGSADTIASGRIKELLAENCKDDAECKEFPQLPDIPSDADRQQLHNIYQQILKKGNDKKKEIAKNVAPLLIPKMTEHGWSNRIKEYTEVLSYGVGGKYVYQDVQRMRTLLKTGIIDKPRDYVADKIDDDKIIYREKSFLGIDREGNEIEVQHTKRYTLSTITKDDWLLIAAALVEVPNHLYVRQEDIDEYAICADSFIGNASDKDKLVKEYLMALGYADNEDILRYQCKHFTPTPKLLIYMVYEKIYKALSKNVCFYDNAGNLSVECQNEDLLNERCGDILQSYGIKLPDNLNPVKDVIYDYRPYMKALPYYQGVKAEFLCRMLNDGIQLLDIDSPAFIVDGFGGSGAISMNSFYKEKFQAKHIYNDLGTMNTSFYKELKANRIGLEKRVTEIIDKAFSLSGTKYIDALFAKFESLIDYRRTKTVNKLEEEKKNKENLEKAEDTEEQIKDINKKIENAESIIAMLDKYKPKILTNIDIEKNYIMRYSKRVNDYRGKPYSASKKSLRAVWLQNRLMYFYESYAENLEIPFDNTFQALIRSVEKYFHEFMLRCYYLYQILTNEIDMDVIKKHNICSEDLAVVFFFYNSLSHRHFYNDCTFEKIMWFVLNYKDWLVYGEQLFRNVEIEQEDALELLTSEKYNNPHTLWYLDIPYTGTDSSDYVPDWFKVEKFINSLKANQGTYVVSSRCNICLPDEEKVNNKILRVDTDKPVDEKSANEKSDEKRQTDNETAEEKPILKKNVEETEAEEETEEFTEDEIIEEQILKHTKEFHVFDFFNSFVTSEFASEYEKCIETTLSLDDNLPHLEKNHLENGREAQYILISFTRSQESFIEKFSSDEKGRRELESSIAKNNVRVDENYIRRMIASTHYSKVPIEVMITNTKIKSEDSPLQKVTKEISVLPSFKTGIDATQYMAEPLVVYMEYKKFIEIMVELLYKDAWVLYEEHKQKKKKEKNDSDWLEYFRKKYNN